SKTTPLALYELARVGKRRKDGLDRRAQVLVVGRKRELLAEVRERLVDREAGADGRDLEQHAARLAEVDRLEVEAVDDWRRMAARGDHALAPRLLLVRLAGPRDVMHRPGALEAALRRRVVVDVEAAALVATSFPPGREPEPPEEGRRAVDVRRVRPDAGEAAERVLARDLRMRRDEQLVR